MVNTTIRYCMTAHVCNPSKRVKASFLSVTVLEVARALVNHRSTTPVSDLCESMKVIFLSAARLDVTKATVSRCMTTNVCNLFERVKVTFLSVTLPGVAKATVNNCMTTSVCNSCERGKVIFFLPVTLQILLVMEVEMDSPSPMSSVTKKAKVDIIPRVVNAIVCRCMTTNVCIPGEKMNGTVILSNTLRIFMVTGVEMVSLLVMSLANKEISVL